VSFNHPSLTMKSVYVLLLASTASAAILPINLVFDGMQTNVGTVKQCEGHENDVMVVNGGSMPEEICMPGTIQMTTDTIIKQDLPMDLIIYMDLKKLTPFPMTIPCLNGIGSCEYEACPLIEEGTPICDALPDTQPCHCPLLAGNFRMNDVKIPVQDMGPVLGPLMEGGYSAKMTWYGASDKDNILACLDMTFTLKKC